MIRLFVKSRFLPVGLLTLVLVFLACAGGAPWTGSKDNLLSDGRVVLMQLHQGVLAFKTDKGYFPEACQLTKPTDPVKRDFRPTWMDEHAKDIGASITFDLPSGEPPFDFYIGTNGEVRAYANSRDTTLFDTVLLINLKGEFLVRQR